MSTPYQLGITCKEDAVAKALKVSDGHIQPRQYILSKASHSAYSRHIDVPSRTLYNLQTTTVKAGDADINLVSPVDLAQRPQFSASKYTTALNSRVLGQTLLLTASLPSTQTMLHQNFSRLPDGTICIADTQTSGKGSA